jgi:hypothetical protein
MIRRLLLSVLTLATGCSGSRDAMPEPILTAMPAPTPTIPWRPLAEAELRRRSGIEGGTQYLFEMAALADQAVAEDAIPEVVAAVRSGPGRQEAATVLSILGADAADVVPDLVDLAGGPDREAADAALRAIDGMTYVSRCPDVPRIRRRRAAHGGS